MDLGAFLVVAGLLIVTPGQDMALVTRTAVAHGRGAALMTAAGIGTGLLAWAAASVLGLTTLLQTSPVGFALVKLAGAAYLVYLGARILLSLRGTPGGGATATKVQATERSGAATEIPHPVEGPGATSGTSQPAGGARSDELARTEAIATGESRGAGGRGTTIAASVGGANGVGSPFGQGLLCNLLNPKIAVFFTSFIPQFVTPGPSAALQSALLAGTFIALGLLWLTLCALVASRIGAMLRRRRVRLVLDLVTGLVLVGFGLRLALDWLS